MSDLASLPLSTPVPLEKAPFQLDYTRGIFHMGSCFSQEIGARLSADQFQVFSSPFGIVYDPLAMADQLDMLLDDRTYSEQDLVYDGQLYHSLDHHGDYSGTDAGIVLKRINGELERARNVLPEWDIMILTFAHTRSFIHEPTGRRAANCHQLPASDWKQEEPTLDALIGRYVGLINRLQAIFPSLHIVVTISPVRYFQRGILQNSRSKARLQLLAESLETLGTWTFPSFEVLNDELRDYRYYDRDLVHPSQLAIDLIYHRWLECTLDPSSRGLHQRIRGIRRDLEHRVRFPQTERARSFRQALADSILALRKAHPHLPWLFIDERPSDGPP